MPASFSEIDPYEVLGVDTKATPLEIKKAYKKLSLKFHPDKIQQRQANSENQHLNEQMFPQIQFAYSVLSDPARRQRYDATGALQEGEGEFFNWKEYFESLNEKITIEMIEEDRLKYQGSQEESSDILQNFVYYEGDFLKLFEVIPHLEFNESEEERVYKIIEKQMAEAPEAFDGNCRHSFEKYKKSRKTKVKQMLKKLAREAKEAAELEKMMKEKYQNNDLKSIIQKRQETRLDSLIGSLESKFVNKKGKKRAPKELSEDEFHRVQQDLLKKKKRS